MLAAGLLFALRFRAVQNYLAGRAAAYLSHQLDTRISIGNIYFRPFSSLELKDLYVEDQQGDTLLYAGHAAADLDLSGFGSGRVVIERIAFDDTRFSLKSLPDSGNNMSFLIRYFIPREPKERKKNDQRLVFRLDALDLSRCTFTYDNMKDGKEITEGIHFGRIRVTDLDASLSGIDYRKHLFGADIHHLRFSEQSGFRLKQFGAKATIDTNRMEFRDLDIETNRSRIGDYLSFEYGQLGDFSDFIHKVGINAFLKQATLDSRDIEFFAPEVAVTSFRVALNGALSGMVDAIRATDLSVQAGKSTFIRGNYRIDGLPDIARTHFDLQAVQLTTTAADVDELVPQLSRGLRFRLPDVFERLGHVHFAGDLSGLYNHFAVRGQFKTALGQVESDVTLNLQNRTGYAGTLQLSDFDLRRLSGYGDLGLASLTLAIEGEGFTPATINSTFAADIRYLDYNRYRYRSAIVDGSWQRRTVAGVITVDDPNIALDLSGRVSMEADRPAYELEASIKDAALHALHFYKDTLSVSTDIKAGVSGKNLDDIAGDVSLNDLVLRLPDTSVFVQTFRCLASGDSAARTLAIQSEVLDARIHGTFDLYTFPSYFKSIVKRYIPSWQTHMIPPGDQKFDFSLRLKRFEPVALLFVPGLKIAREASMTGRFSKEDHTANLSAYAPVVEIRGIRIHEFILDETTGHESLNLFMTADRVDFTDSLYVKNVNFSNILSRDSARFNLKLSDIDATNQLDLNGLVEFGQGEAARLSLLPSFIQINHEEWKLEEKVRFDFARGVTRINGFELARGQQVARLNGIISADGNDRFDIGFSNFQFGTFSALTRPLGIDMQGTLNGDITITSLLSNPSVTANVRAEDTYYNKTPIGHMQFRAQLDQSTGLIDVDADIHRGGRKTLKVAGTYDVRGKTGLDVDLTMNGTELVVFQPFLRNLVSDIRGTADARLHLTGSPMRPSVSGTCRLEDAGMVVNYLKTNYTVSNEFRVTNSAILLDKAVILDKRGNKAIASGEVDLSNPLIPDIDVTIESNRFMVLNTGFKDNPLYHGTVYGTGVFSFRGPTNHMNIDIAARTDEGTILHIPLNAAGTVNENDFITFVAKDSVAQPLRASGFEGLTMNLDLSVNTDAEAHINTDLGRLSGRGEGALALNITSLGDFEMYGEYVIAQGKFEFTAQDFINKIFEITPGGTLRWTGSPTEALINLKAVYEQRTSVQPLYTAAGRQEGGQRVTAQAEMNLSGSLLRPDISFGLNFPQDAYVKDELQSYLSDANNVNQQALSLIVRRNFSPGSGTNLTSELNTTVLGAGTELAFNQLNNIISQSLNLNFVDFNIRSFNEASASIRLMKDRLIFTGGVMDRRNQLTDLNLFGNQVATDAELIYLIRPQGNLMLRASNRLNNRNFLNPNDEYVSAFGLIYRQEFDTVGEFFRRMLNLPRGKE